MAAALSTAPGPNARRYDVGYSAVGFTIQKPSSVMRFISYACMAALAACVPWAPSPMAAARTLTGVPDVDLPATSTLTPTTLAADSVTALDTSMVADLSNDGRQLTVFSAVGLLTDLAGRVLDAFIGEAAGAAVDAVFGSQVVPVNLAQLIDDALEEIDRIVGDQIAEAFSNDKKALLNSLGRQVREYTRRNNLEISRGEIRDMLTAASDLLSFFEDNGVVTNAAFQTTLGLRLSLQLELLQLDELLGESAATLAVVKNNIRAQARNGKATLEDWAATFQPTTNTESVKRVSPCGSFLPSGVCRSPSSKRKDMTVCMVLESPGLEKPDSFCREQVCRSKHVFGHIRKRRIKRCLDNAEPGIVRLVRAHAQVIGIAQFRERNEATVFGEGFRPFLEALATVEDLELAGASLPEVGAAPSEA